MYDQHGSVVKRQRRSGGQSELAHSGIFFRRSRRVGWGYEDGGCVTTW